MSFCLYCVGDFDRLKKGVTIYFSSGRILRGGGVRMCGEIVFYTPGSTIEYGGEIFPAGELTADILNFAPEDYPPIQRLLDRMKDLTKQYEDTLDRGIWWELNNPLMELRSRLMRYRVFQILLKEDDRFLNATKQYTESYSFFTDEEMDE